MTSYLREQTRMIFRLNKLIEGHRDMLAVTCEEKCICWDIEQVIEKHKLNLKKEENGK
jgi:hypothetical protein